MCLDISTIDEPIDHNTSSASEPSADAKPIKKLDRPFYCLRCARQHPPTATHCDCRTPPVPLKSKNHPDRVRELCIDGLDIAIRTAEVFDTTCRKNRIKHRLDFESQSFDGLFNAAMICDRREDLGSFKVFALVCIQYRLSGYRNQEPWKLSNIHELPEMLGEDGESLSFANHFSPKDFLAVENSELVREVQAAMQFLTPLQLATVTRSILDESPIDEIAKELRIGLVEAFQAKDRAIGILRERLGKRLSMVHCGNESLVWKSKSFGIAVPPNEQPNFERQARLMLTETERMALNLHLVEGIGIKRLANLTKCDAKPVGIFVKACISKISGHVRFDSLGEYYARSGNNCAHCRSRKARSNCRGLCLVCYRVPKIRDQYLNRRNATNERKIEQVIATDPSLASQTKRCAECQVEKSIFKFQKKIQRPDGRLHICADCSKDRNRRNRRSRQELSATPQEGAA